MACFYKIGNNKYSKRVDAFRAVNEHYKPFIQKNVTIKEGISELFESNESIANAVYEALGFKQSSDYFLTNLSNQNIRGFEEIKDSHSLIEALKKFTFITDKQIELLNKFKAKTKNIPVTITTLPTDKKGKVGAQVKNGKGGVPLEIQFDKEIGNNIHFAIHELSHQYIWENFTDRDLRDLDLLFDEFKKQHGTKDYGFSKSTEFLSEIISNKDFYDKVKDLKISDKSLTKDIIERFFEKLTKIFNNLFQDNYNKELSFVDNVTNYYYGIDLKGTQITQQQKQQAQQLYSSYLQTTNNPTIEGFKQWNNRQQQINELFKSNPELANDVYSAMGLTTINKSEITYTDEEGNPCAKMGLTNTVKGTDWKIVKDFKGKPKHSQGGVDISISDTGVTMRRGGKDIKAKYGLLIINNN